MNEQNWMPALMVIGVLAFVAIVFRFVARSSRKIYENLCELAERLNLQIEEVKPVLGFYRNADITGEIRGKRVRIYTYTTGTSKSKTIWSAISVAPREHGGLTFTFSRQGLGTRVLEMFGAEEIKIGDASFDQEWFIQTNAPDFLGAGLLPEMRRKIQPHRGKWKLADGEVTYAEKGSFSSRERCMRFVSIADAACDLADVAEVYAKQD